MVPPYPAGDLERTYQRSRERTGNAHNSRTHLIHRRFQVAFQMGVHHTAPPHTLFYLAKIAHRNGNIPSLRGRIIFIENVRRNPELIRQFLNSMLERNFFDGAAAVVFCHFTRCGTQEEIDALLKEFAPKLKVPVFKGFPFGHHPRNLAIDLSRKAVIRNGEIVFEATGQK